METPRLKGKKVTVVGLAKSGVAAARLCLREGAQVTVTDRRTEEQLSAVLPALVEVKKAPEFRGQGGGR